MSETQSEARQDWDELRRAAFHVMSLIEAGTPVYRQDYAAGRLRDALSATAPVRNTSQIGEG